MKINAVQLPHLTFDQKDSGTLGLLHRICRRGNLLETSHQDVQTSFRWHDWKTSYAEMICRWVSATITEEEYNQVSVSSLHNTILVDPSPDMPLHSPSRFRTQNFHSPS